MNNRETYTGTVRLNRVGVNNIIAGGVYVDGKLVYHFPLYSTPAVIADIANKHLKNYPNVLEFDVTFTARNNFTFLRNWKRVGKLNRGYYSITKNGEAKFNPGRPPKPRTNPVFGLV